jgi:thioredoxin 1
MALRSSVAIAFLALAAGACSGGAAEPARQAASAPAPRRTGALPRQVFFMNPNGGPCQIQDGVLRDMAGELSARAEVVYYRTTERADLAQFARYGIRSLPALVLTDASGAELRRATPGIQGPEQIRALVGP